MSSQPTVSKLVQVSEQSAPVVQIPIIVGNEMFVLTQQDVRRTEDIRFLSYAPMLPNQNFPMATPCSGNASPPTCPDVEMKNVPQKAKIADVFNQIKWSKQNSATSMFPVRCSVGTSTTDIQRLKNEKQRCRGGSLGTSRGCNTEPRPQTTSQACNTKRTKRRVSVGSSSSGDESSHHCSSDEQPCASPDRIVSKRSNQQNVVNNEKRPFCWMRNRSN